MNSQVNINYRPKRADNYCAKLNDKDNKFKDCDFEENDVI